jgi:hypothetical protein
MSYKNGMFSFVRTLPQEGLELNITCYAETSALDSGCVQNCWSQRAFTGLGPTTLALLNTVNSVWDTMLFINGSYVSKSLYSIAGTTLSMNSGMFGPTPAPNSTTGVAVTLWVFRVTPSLGQRTEIAVEPKGIIPNGDRVLENPVAAPDDILFVMNSTTTDAKFVDAFGTTSGYTRASHHISNAAFTLDVRVTGEQVIHEIPTESLSTSLYATVSIAGIPSNSGRTAFLFSVFSGIPRTRLMLRQEADARYLRVGPLGKVNIADLDQALQTRIGSTRFAYAAPAA